VLNLVVWTRLLPAQVAIVYTVRLVTMRNTSASTKIDPSSSRAAPRGERRTSGVGGAYGRLTGGFT
jgi:hypothetical protein